MLRSLHHFLGLGASPLLHQWKPRRIPAPFPAAARAPEPRVVSLPQLPFPELRSRPGVGLRPFRMSAARPESSTEGEGMTSPVLAAPLAHTPRIRFCQFCGGATEQSVPDGDDKMRAICTLCKKVHYENPKMVVGCIVEHNDKVLLCKRKIEPSYGLWTLPAGFLEVGESAVEGAARETLEEACAEVEVISPFAQLDIPRIAHVGKLFQVSITFELPRIW